MPEPATEQPTPPPLTSHPPLPTAPGHSAPTTTFDIAVSLRRFIAADQLTELRILNYRDPSGPADGKPVSLSAIYRGDQLDEMAREAAKHSGHAEGVYFTPNPLSHVPAGRNLAWLVPASRGRTSHDKDIAGRRWIVTDIDPVRPAGESATDVEKAHAEAAARKLTQAIRGFSNTLPVVVDSGNGYHVYIEIAPTHALTDGHDPDAKRWLAMIDQWLSNEHVQIDRSVFNPARILKVPGTVGCKGAGTAERPWRTARLLPEPEVAEWCGIDSAAVLFEAAPLPGQSLAWDEFLSMFDSLAAEANFQPEPDHAEQPAGTSSAGRKPRSRSKPLSPAQLDRIRSYLSKVEPAISGDGGHNRTFRTACQLILGFDLSPAEALPLFAEWNATCQPPWTAQELSRKLDQADKRTGPRGYLNGPSLPGSDDLAAVAAIDISEIERTLPWLTGRNAAGELLHGRIGTDGAAEDGKIVRMDAGHTVGLIPGQNGHAPAGTVGSQKPSAPSSPPRPATAIDPIDREFDDPHRLAREFLRLYTATGTLTLRYWREEFHEWADGCYVTIKDKDFRGRITTFCDRYFTSLFKTLQANHDPESRRPAPKPPRVTTGLVANVAQAIAGEVLIASHDEQPAWLDEPAPWSDLHNCVACRNSIVNINSVVNELPDWSRDPSPKFFSANRLSFEYNPDAPAPLEWFRFLQSVWGDDPEAVAALQEWMGYLLIPDTAQQKMLMVIGPKRSGKGTIVAVINELVGHSNVLGTRLRSLSNQFGLSDWLGKLVAIIPDARLNDRDDRNQIVENLLSISGEDKITIERKHLSSISTQLRTRVVLLSNEPPLLRDSATALSSRFIYLNMKHSFLGREDHQLRSKLIAELPSILIWAIAGWQRLQARGHFLQPASGMETMREMEVITSPITAFVDDICELEDGAEVACADLFKRWEKWCEANGNKAGSSNVFSRNLKARYPQIGTQRHRNNEARNGAQDGFNGAQGFEIETASRYKVYQNIRIKVTEL